MKHKHNFTLSVVLGAILACAGTMAAAESDQEADAQARAQQVEKNLQERMPGITEVEAQPTMLPNIYEVVVNGSSIYYMSEDARYVIQGDMVDLETRENITERRRSGARLDVLANLSAEATIMFAPEDKPVKHEITVFTDIDCGYCRKLHREIAQLNDLGIAVRYAFFPRSGPNSPSWEKAEDVACSNNRNVALTMAKAGEEVTAEACETEAVFEGWSAGRSAGVTGTPAIVTENGFLIGGYLPATQLKARLDQLASSGS